ncbi:protein FRA10AC [Salix suchowensis]|nr:protein FRA10AC [Salix suchowensis]
MLKPCNGSSTRALDDTPTDCTRQQNFLTDLLSRVLYFERERDGLFGSLKSAILEREERKQKHQSHIRGLNACDRHNKSWNEYVSFMGKENLPMRRVLGS